MKNIFIILIAFSMLISLWLIFKMNNNDSRLPSDVTQSSLKQIDFTLPDLHGKQQSFSQWNGKVILLNFWATWCPPCRREMPDFIEVYNQYKDKNFVVVGVGVDNEQLIADFVKHLDVNYPILVGGRSAMQVSHQYGNHQGALPYSIIIDKQGFIRYRAGGLISKNQLLSQITPLL